MKTFALAASIAVAPGATLAAGCQETFGTLIDMLVAGDAIEEAPTALVRQRPDNWCGVRALRVPLADGRVLAIEDFAWRGVGMDRFVDAGLPPTALEVNAKAVRFARRSGSADLDEQLLTILAEDGVNLGFAGEWQRETRKVIVHSLSLGKDSGDLVSLTAVLNNIDLTSEATMQMSAGGLSLSEAMLSVRTVEAFVPYFTRGGGMSADDTDELLERFPDDTLDEGSRVAIRRFAESGPVGDLRVGLAAEGGFGAARFLPYVIGGANPNPSAIWDGVEIDVSFSPL